MPNRHVHPTRWLIALLLSSVALPAHAPADAGDKTASDILVRVNGEAITRGELELLMLTRSVENPASRALRERFLQRLIDRRLMRAFLVEQQIKPGAAATKARIEQFHKLIRKRGHEPKPFLKKLGYNDKTFRREIELPLLWQTYLDGVITPDELRKHFLAHQQEFDGTRVRASQIYLKLPNSESADAKDQALKQLAAVRDEIAAGAFTFAEAARQHSQAPSATNGGDVGYFTYRGVMPESLTSVAFSLKLTEMSEPFVSPFGAHLIMVTDRKPGNESLEDARRAVRKHLDRTLWEKNLSELRAKTKIER